MTPLRAGILAATAAMVMVGCDGWPGQPRLDEVTLAPAKVADFQRLFRANCAGCHGSNGAASGAIALDDQLYLTIVPPDVLRSAIANGVPGSLMPAFSQARGGSLTNDQIDILVRGIYGWKRDATVLPATLPAYAAPPGDTAAGQTAYAAYEAALRKTAPASVFADGFMANPAFLNLVSNQYLRTLILVGRPELGIPNFKDVHPGQPLNDTQIADIVAWLISQRKNEFGQPLNPSLP